MTKEQQRAVESTARELSIVACAGSGKTTTIVNRVARLVNNGIAKPDQITVITFTVKAADELRARLQNAVANTRHIADLYCGTIHAFCHHVLTRFLPHKYGNLRVFSDVQQLVLLSIKRHDWDTDRIDPARYASSKGAFFSSLSETLNIAKLEGLAEDPTLVAAHPEFFRVLDLYCGYLRSNDLADFADLVQLTRVELSSTPSFAERVQARAKWLFVDEYQDVDPSQHALIRAISAAGQLCVVGDDDQSIYQFRGTDPSHFIELSAEAQDREVVILETNFRCRSAIGSCARDIITGISNRIVKPMRFGKEGGVVRKAEFPTVDEEARFIAEEIARLMREKCVQSYSDVAILLRSVSSYGQTYLDALRATGIPFATRGDRSLFNDPQVSLVCAVLDFIACPDDAVDGIESLAPLLGIDFAKLSSLSSEFSSLSDSDLVSCGASVGVVQHLREWEQIRTRYRARKFSGFIDLVHDIIATLDVLGSESSIATCYNLGALTQIVNDFDEIAQTKNLRMLCGFFAMYASTMADKVEAPDWVEAVNVMTIHQAKGLQFSTVFIPMLCEGRFPLEQQTRSWMLPSSVFDSSRYLGSMDDERRLFYVAATRAADRLYLTFAREVGTRRRRNPSVFYSACSSTPTMTSPTPSLPSNAKDSESPLSLSYSSMELYLSCPFRYRLAHEVRIATPENPFFEFGRILHYVARLMHELHASGERLTPGDIEKLYEDHFHIRLHVPEFTVIRRKAAGIRALKHYYATRRAWFDQMTAVEQAFDVVDTNTILRGQYDLLISDKGKTTIIDFKTGSPHDYINTKLQMMLYAWAAETALGLSVRNTIVFYMERDEEMSYTPTSSLTAGARTTFLKVAAAIKGRAFAPTPGRVCMRCEYRKVCPHREEGVRYD